MSATKDMYVTIPNYPLYECLNNKEKGVRIQRKKVPRGTRMGVHSHGHTGGKVLAVSRAGDVVLKRGPNRPQERQNAEEVWHHVFHGAPLLFPTERKALRMAEAKALRESKTEESA